VKSDLPPQSRSDRRDVRRSHDPNGLEDRSDYVVSEDQGQDHDDADRPTVYWNVLHGEEPQ